MSLWVRYIASKRFIGLGNWPVGRFRHAATIIHWVAEHQPTLLLWSYAMSCELSCLF